MKGFVKYMTLIGKCEVTVRFSEEDAREWLEDKGLELDDYGAYAWHLIEIDDCEYESVTVYR